MEIIDENQKTEKDEMMKHWERAHNRGKIIGGLILVVIGSIFLLREMGTPIPNWILSWKMLLIIIGVFVGFKHNFEKAGWIIPVLIGSAFLIQDFLPDFRISHFFWPILIIIFGILMIFKPKRSQKKWEKYEKWHKHDQWEDWKQQAAHETGEDYIEANAIFGSVKKNIVSKNFKGGEVNAVFGGCEINLMQAEIQGKIVLEMNQVFGGTKLIVPAHWEIHSELTAVLGSVEDKRPQVARFGNNNGAILILRGSAVFGGIDINSY
jgi:predicted membrane protein